MREKSKNINQNYLNFNNNFWNFGRPENKSEKEDFLKTIRFKEKNLR